VRTAVADLVRTDRHNHRSVAGDSAEAEAIKVLARAHQSLIWTRTRHTNALRNALREYYPAALTAFDDLAHGDALGVLDRPSRLPGCPCRRFNRRSNVVGANATSPTVPERAVWHRRHQTWRPRRDGGRGSGPPPAGLPRIPDNRPHEDHRFLLDLLCGATTVEPRTPGDNLMDQCSPARHPTRATGRLTRVPS
jgi:Transposase